MILHIKNMVCDRCIMVVEQQLENLNFKVNAISLGSAEISPEPDAAALSQIASSLKLSGFELIDKEKDVIIERIKNVIVELIHHSDISELKISFSELIANNLHKDYSQLSRLFSESEDITIERYIIQQKIEKVKELLEYGELNLNEIALRMGYSSSAHLSSQFKSVTGLTPSQYRTAENYRKPLDKI